MSLFDVFTVAGSGMSAQTIRLNTIASNLANANSVSGSEKNAYKAKQPVFSSVLYGMQDDQATVGVKVDRIVEDQRPSVRRYDPSNPMANAEGYIYLSNVNTVEEMTNMISASRSYQNNVESMNTAKQMMLATLRLGE